MRPMVPALVDLYHLTNEEGYKGAVETGWVECRSHPFWRFRYDKKPDWRAYLTRLGCRFKEIEQLMRGDKFVVGFDKPIPIEWIHNGLGPSIVNKIISRSTRVETKGKIYSLHLEASPQRMFVRDHWYASPAYFLEQCGKDLFTDLEARKEHRDIFYKGLADYFNSTVRWFDFYAHPEQFKIPELWCSERLQLKAFSGVKELSEKGIKTLRGE